MRLRPQGALTSALRPSGAVHNGICCTSFADTYCSLGCRFAVSRTAGAHLCPPSFGRSSQWHLLHFVCRYLLLTGLPPRSLPLWGAEPAAAGGRNLIRLASRSTFPIGEGKAGGSVVSKEASQAPPARCEATIANLTEAKQEVAARRADG